MRVVPYLSLWLLAAAPVALAQDSAARAVPMHVPGRTVADMRLTDVQPVYPAKALAQHIDGPVKLHVVITKEGAVRDITVRSGPPELCQAAIDAVSQWTYKPYRVGGKPVEIETLVLVSFHRSDAAPGDEPDDAWPAHPVDGPPHVSSSVMAAQLLTHVPPVYPEAARADNIEGAVVLHAIVGEAGLVQSLDVVSGPDALRNSALEAVKRWTYRPYRLNGKPTAVDTFVTLNYRLPPAVHTTPEGSPKK